MRLSIDPMPALRQKAIERVNSYFAQAALSRAHTDLAHDRKARAAQAVLDGGTDVYISEEAAIRGLTTQDLAGVIAAKSKVSGDAVMKREVERQRLLGVVGAADSLASLNAALLSFDLLPLE